MPGVHGGDLVRRLAATGRVHRALLVSGYAPDGFDIPAPYLAKPFTDRTLLARVREVLDATGP
jgi:DNA-binding response OmpR family regulator